MLQERPPKNSQATVIQTTEKADATKRHAGPEEGLQVERRYTKQGTHPYD